MRCYSSIDVDAFKRNNFWNLYYVINEISCLRTNKVLVDRKKVVCFSIWCKYHKEIAFWRHLSTATKSRAITSNGHSDWPLEVAGSQSQRRIQPREATSRDLISWGEFGAAKVCDVVKFVLKLERKYQQEVVWYTNSFWLDNICAVLNFAVLQQ